MNKIIAVVGMCGSGKSVAVEEFEKRGYKKIYFGAATMRELDHVESIVCLTRKI